MKPMPRRAFAEVSGFEAKKHNIRQTTAENEYKIHEGIR